MKKLLITGGSGFIGTNLIDALMKDNYSILNIDSNQPKKKTQVAFWRNLNILDLVNLENEILKFDPDIIIHLAAVTDLNGKDLEYYKANVEGTQNIIVIADKLMSLKKVIFASSMYVCKPGYIPADYNDYKPHTLYGESKVQGELLVKSIERKHYDWIIIRPTSIWGPWFGIPYIDFFKVVYEERYFDFGKSCTKTYGYIENTVMQIQKLMISEQLHGKVFYLGDDPPININKWAEEISHEMNKGPIKRIPIFVIKIAATVGDLLAKFNLKFPITSFRLRNMTTDNILPLQDLYNITGPPRVERTNGIRKTLDWLVEYNGYRK